MSESFPGKSKASIMTMMVILYGLTYRDRECYPEDETECEDIKLGIIEALNLM